MPVRGKTAHVRTNYGNDRLRAGVPDTGYILDCLGSLFFLRLHEVVDLIIQIFNVDVQFVQMCQKLFHHPALQRTHDTIEVVYDLFFGGFEIMGKGSVK